MLLGRSVLLCEYTLVLVLVSEVAHASSHLILVQGDVVMPGLQLTVGWNQGRAAYSPVGGLVDWIPPCFLLLP